MISTYATDLWPQAGYDELQPDDRSSLDVERGPMRRLYLFGDAKLGDILLAVPAGHDMPNAQYRWGNSAWYPLGRDAAARVLREMRKLARPA